MSSFVPQVNDLVAWASNYLDFNEPLPASVRGRGEHQKQHLLGLFTKDKTFGLDMVYDISAGDDPLHATATLFAYINSTRHQLASFENEDINKTGGVLMKFNILNTAVGTFNLFVKKIGTARQIWGKVKASVTVQGHEEKFEDELYLFPVVPLKGPN